MELRIAHFTDTHFQDDSEKPLLGLDSEALFYRALDALEATGAQPDVLVVTGDLANNGHPGAYTKAKKAFAAAGERLGCPVVLTLGNHDSRENFAAEFLPGRTFGPDERWNQVIDLKGYRFLVLDAKSPGHESKGSFTAPQLEWLETELNRDPEVPVVIVFHQPLVLTPLKLMDGMDFIPGPAQAFRDLAARFPRIVGILNGHTHFNILTTLGTIAVNVCAGNAFGLNPYSQGKMDFVDSSWFNLVTVRDRAFLSCPVAVQVPTKVLFRFEAGKTDMNAIHDALGM